MALLGLLVLPVSRVCLMFLVLWDRLDLRVLLGLLVLLLLSLVLLGLLALRVRRVWQVRKVTPERKAQPGLPLLFPVLSVLQARRVTLGRRDLLVPLGLRAIRVLRASRASKASRVFLVWVSGFVVRSLTLLSCRMTLCRAICGCWAIGMTIRNPLRL
jgi:hypothetical protein